MIDKRLILNRIRVHLNIKNDTEFAKYLGINRNVLSNWKARNTYDISILTQKCDFLNKDYLLTGNGEMIKSNGSETNNTNSTQTELEYYKSQLELIRELLKEKEKYINMIQPLADQVLKELLERKK